MQKAVIILGVLAVVFVYEASCQRFILSTWRPPPKRHVIIRARRAIEEPQWLYKDDDVQRAPAAGDHPFLPNYIDDIELKDPHTRVARSLGTPTETDPQGSPDTHQSASPAIGPAQPGYNRRFARDLPFLPKLTKIPPYKPRLPPPPNPLKLNRLPKLRSKTIG